jgi:tetratricopeptide (TPR) repeat protein
MQLKVCVRAVLFVVTVLITVLILPPHSIASTSSELVDIGNAFMDSGRYQDALNAFEKALEIDPENANTWGAKVVALEKLGRFQEAIDASNKATKLDPDLLDAWIHKGYLLNGLSKRQDANVVFQKVINISDRLIAIDPNGNTWKNKGDNPWHYKGSALNALGKYEDALIAYNIARSIDPNNQYSWSGKGNTLFELGKYQKAADSYDIAIKIRPDETQFWRAKGDALKALGKVQEANEAYNKAYELTITASAISGSASSGVKGLFSDGVIYFVIILLILLLLIVIILYFKKMNLKKRDKVTEHQRSDIEYQKHSEEYIKHDVFISYSSADKKIADATCANLESKGIRCWIAPRDVMPGKNYQGELIDAIDNTHIMVLIFSSNSNTSPYIIRELTEAVEKGVIIIPFRIEDVMPSKEMKFLINVPHWLDAMTPPLERHLEKLAMASINRWIDSPDYPFPVQ